MGHYFRDSNSWDLVSVVSEEREWIVPVADRKERLDRFLAGQNPDLSRTRLSHLIDEGNVTVNGKEAERHYPVKRDDRIVLRIPPPQSTEILPEPIPLEILFEDSDLIAVNKPAGMLVHPVLHVNSGTLVNALLYHCKDLQGIGGEIRPGIVHRLDRDTSGVLVVAKNSAAQNFLMKQFKGRKVKKTYLALVYGIPKENEGVLDQAIGRSLTNRQKMAAFPAATVGQGRKTREAKTRYRVIQASKNFSFMEVFPETGRTHQIRVHLAHLGYPVVGDTIYARRRSPEWAPRQMLHAKSLEIIHPRSKRNLQFEAPLPEDFQKALQMACYNPGNP